MSAQPPKSESRTWICDGCGRTFRVDPGPTNETIREVGLKRENERLRELLGEAMNWLGDISGYVNNGQDFDKRVEEALR